MIKLKIKRKGKTDEIEVEYKRDKSNSYEHLFAIKFIADKLVEEGYEVQDIISFILENHLEEVEEIK